jgi:hypothetical protein
MGTFSPEIQTARFRAKKRQIPSTELGKTSRISVSTMTGIDVSTHPQPDKTETD